MVETPQNILRIEDIYPRMNMLTEIMNYLMVVIMHKIAKIGGNLQQANPTLQTCTKTIISRWRTKTRKQMHTAVSKSSLARVVKLAITMVVRPFTCLITREINNKKIGKFQARSS